MKPEGPLERIEKEAEEEESDQLLEGRMKTSWNFILRYNAKTRERTLGACLLVVVS